MTDNVTPITPRTTCSGCGADVAHEDRFDPIKHGPNCRQPEIRLRRVEGQLQELLAGFRELAEAHNEGIREILKLKEIINARTTSPETQRSGGTTGHGQLCSCEACHPRDAHPDSRTAEPERAEADGPVPAADESGRAEGPDAGLQGAGEGGAPEPRG